jgi:hypothetical protein
MIDGQPVASQNSHSAAALHARLQAATRDARLIIDQESRALSPRRRRLTAAEPWALIQTLQQSGASVDRTLSMERALRRVLASVLEEDVEGVKATHTDIDTVEGPVLVIRSGPWPVLRALLARLATNERARPITVLCHRRDESALAAVGAYGAPGGGLGLEILPLFYPRFEPFNTSTLRRVIAGGAWRTTFVLDGSKTGRGESLEHVTTAVSSRNAYVWNAGGMTWRQRTLRERLSRENYALVRGLLRWHACRKAT